MSVWLAIWITVWVYATVLGIRNLDNEDEAFGLIFFAVSVGSAVGIAHTAT